MRALLLISILVATVAVPLWTARDPDARRGLSRAVVYTIAASALYLLACAFLFHRLP